MKEKRKIVFFPPPQKKKRSRKEDTKKWIIESQTANLQDYWYWKELVYIEDNEYLDIK